MLQRTTSYKALLRIVGGGLLLYGFYVIVLALTAQIKVSGSMSYTGPMIFENPEIIRNYLFCGGLFLGNPILPGNLNTFGTLTPGPFFWVSLGMLCLSATSMRVNVAYVCLQIALWLISLSIWFPMFYLLGFTNYNPESFVPFWLITLALSLVLLAFYKLVTHFLRTFFESKSAVPIAKMGKIGEKALE